MLNPPMLKPSAKPSLSLHTPHNVSGVSNHFAYSEFGWKTVLDDDCGTFVIIEMDQYGGVRARLGANRPENMPLAEGRITNFYKNTLEELLGVLSDGENFPSELFDLLVDDLYTLGFAEAQPWCNWLKEELGLGDVNLDFSALKLQLQSDAHR